jgi:hypothetical protein
MPALPATPSGVVKIALGHSVEEDALVTSSHCLSYTGGAPTSADLEDIATSVSVTWAEYLAPMMTPDGYLGSVTVYDLANPATVEGVWSGSEEGTRTGALPSIATCALMQGHIDRRYRGSRPKLFLPYGVVADSEDINQWTGDFLTEMPEAWGDYITNLAVDGAGSTVLGDPVGVSYYHGFTVVTSPTTGRARNVPTVRDVPLVSDIISYTLRARFGSQRRRINAG